MPLLSFDGKIHLLSLGLSLVAGQAPMGPRDQERFLEPVDGPGWAAVARVIFQRGTAKGELAGAFAEAAGGGRLVDEARLCALHDEARSNAVTLVNFATAKRFIQAESFLWSAAQWGLANEAMAARLNKELATCVAAWEPVGRLIGVANDAAAEAGGAASEKFEARVRLVTGAYRSERLRRALETAVVASGRSGVFQNWTKRGAVERLLVDEMFHAERVRMPRASVAGDRERRNGLLDEKIEALRASGLDFRGLDVDDARRVVSKNILTRDLRLRLVASRGELIAACQVRQGALSANAVSPLARVLCREADAIDLPCGSSLQALAARQELDQSVALNVDQLILNARARDHASDVAAAADFQAAAFATRMHLLRAETDEAAAAG